MFASQQQKLMNRKTKPLVETDLEYFIAHSYSEDEFEKTGDEYQSDESSDTDSGKYEICKNKKQSRSYDYFCRQRRLYKSSEDC